MCRKREDHFDYDGDDDNDDNDDDENVLTTGENHNFDNKITPQLETNSWRGVVNKLYWLVIQITMDHLQW